MPGIVKLRSSFCTLAAILIGVAFACPAEAQQQQKTSRSKTGTAKQTPVPTTHRSKNFVIHTDLPTKEARDLLSKLEKMLTLISRYWGRRNPRVIECYVAKDISKWPDSALKRMHPNGVAKIRRGGGVTISRIFRRRGRLSGNAKVYAIAGHGTAMHEAVHAYCAQAFGTTGPVWYSEGMAEMGKYWKEKDSSANCSKYVALYLRRSKPKQLSEIVDPNQKTGDSWRNYAWRWALCHLLANNSNYAPRFRPLGLGLLMKRRVSFKAIYGSMAKEINFEYQFFLKHLEPGFRVDLCSWDWKARFREPSGVDTVTAGIEAGKGWQPSRLRVKAGVTYQYSVPGTWKLSKTAPACTADGDKQGNGKLTGVIFSDYKLGEPFELGAYGKFTAASDGNLLLRCGDKWTELADNKGKVTVKLKIDGNGNPLPKPQVEKLKN